MSFLCFLVTGSPSDRCFLCFGNSAEAVKPKPAQPIGAFDVFGVQPKQPSRSSPAERKLRASAFPAIRPSEAAQPKGSSEPPLDGFAALFHWRRPISLGDHCMYGTRTLIAELRYPLLTFIARISTLPLMGRTQHMWPSHRSTQAPPEGCAVC